MLSSSFVKTYFKKIIDLDLLEQFIVRYDKWWNDISNSLDIYDRNFNWSLDSKPSENNSKLLNDQKDIYTAEKIENLKLFHDENNFY